MSQNHGCENHEVAVARRLHPWIPLGQEVPAHQQHHAPLIAERARLPYSSSRLLQQPLELDLLHR